MLHGLGEGPHALQSSRHSLFALAPSCWGQPVHSQIVCKAECKAGQCGLHHRCACTGENGGCITATLTAMHTPLLPCTGRTVGLWLASLAAMQ